MVRSLVMMGWVGLIVVGIITLAGIAVFFGRVRFESETEALVASLAQAQTQTPTETETETETETVFRVEELEGLPDPVARFFRTVLSRGHPLVRGARIVQRGHFRMSESEDSWRPFSATQSFHVSPPGFVWDARIRMAPGLSVYVRDSYHDKRGAMHAAILGLVPVASVEGTSEIAVAALERYLAEAVWFPTALLPSEGVVWSPINEHAARATLTDGGVSASLEFRFAESGEIESVFTASRYREVDGDFIPTPWEGHFEQYRTRDGMRVPDYGEVAWILDGEPRTYWRGTLVDTQYHWAVALD